MTNATWHAYCQRLNGVRWQRRYLATSQPGERKAEFRTRAETLATDDWQVNIVPASNAPRWLLDLLDGDLSPTETAHLLGVAPATIRDYVRRGLLAPIEIAPGRYRYNRAQVEALRSTRRKPGHPITTGAGLRNRKRRNEEAS